MDIHVNDDQFRDLILDTTRDMQDEISECETRLNDLEGCDIHDLRDDIEWIERQLKDHPLDGLHNATLDNRTSCVEVNDRLLALASRLDELEQGNYYGLIERLSLLENDFEELWSRTLAGRMFRFGNWIRRTAKRIGWISPSLR